MQHRTAVEVQGAERARGGATGVPAALVAAAALGYGWWAAGTRPFTTSADVATAIPFGVGALVAARTFRAGPRRGAVAERRIWPWVVAVALLCLWELATYAAGFAAGRERFPTVSSLYDGAAHARGAKVVLFALWLMLGWGIVRR